MAEIDERLLRRHIHETYGYLPGGLARLGNRWNRALALSAGRENDPPDQLERSPALHRIDGGILAATDLGPGEIKGSQAGNHLIYADPATGLGVRRQERVYWKRKPKRTPWVQPTLKSLEGFTSIRIEKGPMNAAPPLCAAYRFPFLESALRAR